MFGSNVRRPRERNSNSLQAQDVFYTIQGEGPFSGQPAVFIRLTGCNLSCWFCDTVWDDVKDNHYAPIQIVDAVKVESTRTDGTRKTGLVVITGGEPLRQEIGELARMLRREGFTVQVETAGVLWQDWLDNPYVHVVVSPKTKKVHERFYQKEKNVYWKYVIKADQVDKSDGLPNASMQRLVSGKIAGGAPARPPLGAMWNGKTIYLSPMDEHDYKLSAENHLAVGQIAMKYGYRCGVQLHKLLNVA